jgi:hypothetical protein
MNNYKITLYDGKLPYNEWINLGNKNFQQQRRDIGSEILEIQRKHNSPSVFPLKAIFSGLEISEDISVVSITTKKLETDWGKLPVSVLVFESISEDGNEVLEARCFMPKRGSKKEKDSYNGVFFNYDYIKTLGSIEKILINEQDNENKISWRIENFHAKEALKHMDRNNEPIYFIDKAIFGSFSYTPLKLPNTYTSAGYAADVLSEYCYLSGLKKEPFKSKQDPDSLIEVANSAVAPLINRNIEEVHIGKSLRFVYGIYTSMSCSLGKEVER